MRIRPALHWLVPLTGLLSLVAAGAALFWQTEGSRFNFTTVQGETVEMFGRGFYKHDTVFSATAALGADAVVLVLALPLLAVSFILARGGSRRGGILLAGVLAFFLYYGASKGLGTAYNDLFLVYIALFSVTFFTFVLAFTSIDLASMPGGRGSLRPEPRSGLVTGLAIFMIVTGLGTAFIWLSDAIPALVANRPPQALGSHTTVVTYSLDLGIIVPAAVLAGILLLQRKPLGSLLALTLAIMLALIGAMVIGQTIYQLNAELEFGPGVLIGMVGSWIGLGAIAVFLAAAFLRRIPDQK